MFSRLQAFHHKSNRSERHLCCLRYVPIGFCKELRATENCKDNLKTSGSGDSSSFGWKQVCGSFFAGDKEIKSGQFDVGVACPIEEEKLHISTQFSHLSGNVW